MDCISIAIGRDIAGRNTAIVPWSNPLVGHLVAVEVLRQRVVQPVEQLAGRLVEASAGRRVVGVAVGRSEQHHRTWS